MLLLLLLLLLLMLPDASAATRRTFHPADYDVGVGHVGWGCCDLCDARSGRFSKQRALCQGWRSILEHTSK